MSQLIIGTHICSICNKESNECFSLEYTLTDKFSQEETADKVGCSDCLKKGEFEFWHDTEYGMLDENGLKKVYKHNMANPPSVDNKILVELRRTPQIVTWQQELWLTHCNDFMVYKGTWTPEDFNKYSKNSDGRQLFLEMTDDEWNHLWDESLEEGEVELKEWYATYYVFECSHCGKLRGNWDCD
ncbi:MAG: CbrC family protein [Sporocytophaga sp.]|nr:CbrC family protein [Sporocytophaga sp.]